ncbi:hypothetical protein FRB93_005879 [Tulasnella sp. JGI-2019a]|nr:hypothetical protein FRB93_005879 [Tulasnella sp. JGI-2019a]
MRNPTIIALVVSTSCTLAAPVYNDSPHSDILHTNPNLQKREPMFEGLYKDVVGVSKGVAKMLKGGAQKKIIGTISHDKAWVPTALSEEVRLAEIAEAAVPRSAAEKQAAKDTLEKLATKDGNPTFALDRAHILLDHNWKLHRLKVLKNNAGMESVDSALALSKMDHADAGKAAEVLEVARISPDLAQRFERANVAAGTGKMDPLLGGVIPWDTSKRLEAINQRIAENANGNSRLTLLDRLNALDELANEKARIAHFASGAKLPEPIQLGPGEVSRPWQNKDGVKSPGPLLPDVVNPDQYLRDRDPRELQIARQPAQSWIGDAQPGSDSVPLWSKGEPEKGVQALPDANGKKGNEIVLVEEMNRRETGKLLKLATVTAVVLGGYLIVDALGQKKLADGQTVLGSGKAPEEGALAEVDEQTIYNWTVAHPDKFEDIMAQIRSIPGISQKELNLFETANPANPPAATAVAAAVGTPEDKAVTPATPATVGPSAPYTIATAPARRRSLTDLD